MACRNKLIHNPISGQSIRFLQTSTDTDGELLEMESSFSPFSTEPIAHYHPQQQEVFTVLEGSLYVRLKGETKMLKKGEQLNILPNTVHSMWNPFPLKAVINWKVQPALSTEYFLETGMGLARDGKVNKKGLPSVLQTALLARQYKNVFRLAKPSYFVQRVLFGVLTPVSKLVGYKAIYRQYID